MFMKINVNEWENFKLIDLFDIKRGTFCNINDAKPGRTPLVTAYTQNNGVSQYIEFDEDYVVNGNCLTVANTGQGSVFRTFYQPHLFIPSNNVSVLIPKFHLNTYIGLFICTLCWLEIPKYSYGRIVNNDRLSKTFIKLPAKNNTPDWEFMENYIKSLKSRPITSNNLNYKNNLNIKNWKEFKVGDLFNTSNIRGHLSSLNELNMGDTEVVSTTENNNGVIGKFDVDKIYKNRITVSFNGACGFFSYHAKPFNANSDVGILEEKFKLNKYNAMFLICILNKLAFKFQYGRKLNGDRLKDEFIFLPAKDDQPDWQFMENYIKALKYADRI